MMMPIKPTLYLLPRFDALGASSRMRTFQYVRKFRAQFDEVILQPLFDNDMLVLKYKRGNYAWKSVFLAYFHRAATLLEARKKKSILFIEKELFPWIPAFVELFFLKKNHYVLDFDDAIFHKYDLHPNMLVRHIYSNKIDVLMRHASLVTTGNQYLAERAKIAGAKSVEVIPTVIDLDRYSAKNDFNYQNIPRVVWIGSPSTTQYLKDISEPLRKLSIRRPFVLRLIGAASIDLPEIDIEYFSWSLLTEATLIKECDIGIMPLKDTPWEQGKCSYKLIQYMASGLPTVSSPVGANLDVVVNGETGYFASSDQEWESTLFNLLQDSYARINMGMSGRKRVEDRYSLQITEEVLSSLVLNLATSDHGN